MSFNDMSKRKSKVSMTIEKIYNSVLFAGVIMVLLFGFFAYKCSLETEDFVTMPSEVIYK